MDERQLLFRKMSAQQTDQCLVWPFDRGQKSFGRIIWQGRPTHVATLACTIARGPGPDGAVVLHEPCGNPACITSSHLWWGLPAVLSLGSQQVLPPLGKPLSKYRTKMNPDRVREIRRRAAAGEKQVTLAAEYGLHSKTLSKIVVGRTWTDLDRGLPREKLTPDQVREIRRRRATGERAVLLAEEFGVSKSMVAMIVSRRAWRGVR